MHICFVNLEKIHSEGYGEVHNYLNQNKQLLTFINRRLGTAQPLKINNYVLVVNKANQIGVSKKIQPQKIRPCKIFDTPTLVTYKLENFSGKQITRHRSNIIQFLSRRTSFKNKWGNTSWIIHLKATALQVEVCLAQSRQSKCTIHG